jgi:hypothetical protein
MSQPSSQSRMLWIEMTVALCGQLTIVGVKHRPFNGFVPPLKQYKSLNMDQDFADSVFFYNVFFMAQVNMIAPLEPYRLNQRMTIQQGIFLAPGNVTESFEDNLMAYDGKDLKRMFIKVVIPNKWRYEILSDLKDMNINSATLFPGLDGFARSLKSSIHYDNEYERQRMQYKSDHDIPLT